jgi:hypothetical protein
MLWDRFSINSAIEWTMTPRRENFRLQRQCVHSL